MTIGPFSYDIRGAGYSFSPNKELTGKHNFSLHLFIDEAGEVYESVRLNIIDDRLREEVIGIHFSRQYSKMHYPASEDVQFYILDRDCPWDFHYRMHDGKEFFLEICRIADRDLLKALRAENDCMHLLQKTWLKGYEILKIEKSFPGTIPYQIKEQIKSKSDKENLFFLGDHKLTPNFFFRPPMSPRKLNLVDEIKSAVRKKAEKRHEGKDRTVLLLDNLTTHSHPDDFYAASEVLKEFLDSSPFPSIWIYTGYYSDVDGSNCEYSLLPLKLTPEEENSLFKV